MNQDILAQMPELFQDRQANRHSREGSIRVYILFFSPGHLYYKAQNNAD